MLISSQVPLQALGGARLVSQNVHFVACPYPGRLPPGWSTRYSKRLGLLRYRADVPRLAGTTRDSGGPVPVYRPFRGVDFCCSDHKSPTTHELEMQHTNVAAKHLSEKLCPLSITCHAVVCHANIGSELGSETAGDPQSDWSASDASISNMAFRLFLAKIGGGIEIGTLHYTEPGRVSQSGPTMSLGAL